MFADRMGINQISQPRDPRAQLGIKLWYNRVILFYQPYGGGVDLEVVRNMLLLDEETADFLYTKFTDTPKPYLQGTRPELEKVLADILTDEMSDFDKALAIMRRVRDNQDHGLAMPRLFYGGNEEDLLKRGAVMCNEVSRLYACLCQIAGIPARLFCSHISGHMMNEIFVNNKWIFVDAMKGLLPLGTDGAGLSAWELFQNPALICQQPLRVFAELRTPEGPHLIEDTEENARKKSFILCRTRDCYLFKHEAIAIGNYHVSDFKTFTYPWAANREPSPAQRENVRAENLNRKAMGWPEYYFNIDLFTEIVKPIDV